MSNFGQAQANAEYPEWQPTDWTPRQRSVAIAGLLSLTVACSLTAWSLTAWGTAPLTMDTLLPIGITALTLGATLLTAVYWYAYRHAQNTRGDRASFSAAINGMLVFVELVASVTLIVQVIGGILVATVGWFEWSINSRTSYFLPAGFGGLVTLALGLPLLTTNWRPTRDPGAPGSMISTPAVGIQLLVRRAVMMVARNSWLLILGAMSIGLNLFSEVNLDTPSANWPIQFPTAVFWFVSAFFLIATVVELLPLPRS